MAEANPKHYNGFVDQLPTNPPWNAKAVDILPKLGCGRLFELKGKVPKPIREFKFFKGKVIQCQWAPASENPSLSNRVVACDQGGQVLIIEARKGTRRGGYHLTGPSKFVQAASVHGKKDVVVSGGMDNKIGLFSESENSADPFLSQKKEWAGEGTKGHDGMIASLRWHPTEDEQFLSAGGDGEVKLWDTNRTDCIQTFYGHSDECTSITFAKDGNPMVFGTCSNDTTVKLWDLRGTKCVASLHALKAEDKLSAADMFPNGNARAAGGQGQATYFWDIRAVKLIAAYKRNNMKVTGVAFMKSGRALFVSHEDGRIIVWDTFGAQENQKYAIKHDAHFIPSDPKNAKSSASSNSVITGVHMKPDGEFLASSSFDSSVKIWGGLSAPDLRAS